MTLKTITAALAATLAFAPLAHADITIGLMAPLTGPVAAIGAQIKNGAETAVEEINKKGGINGEKLVLKIADDAGDPKQGVSAANQLIADDIRFVVGPVTSGVSVPASLVFSENGALMVTPTATAPELTAQGLSTVFRTCGRDDQQAEVAAKYVVEKFKDKKIAILNDKAQYGKGLADAFKKSLNAAGVTEVFNDALNPGDKDFSALVTRMKSEGVEVLYFGGYHPEAGLLVRQMKDAGMAVQLVAGDGLSNSEFVATGGEAANGTIYTNAADALKNEDSKAAAAALTAKNIPAEAFTLNTYAAVEVIAAGIAKAGTTDDAEAVAAALKDGSGIKTAIGELTYGETGDLTSQTFSVYKWEGGKTVAAE
ncbi:branched-chain amino acid transport system substrate-binding protein [Neorhizobium huautlense]|uniref:Branched-chain amino acid transport system substrate-binding protein n=1 Tax=Neorhizobium huautlense TaxID=67774 RepID=A0ABT9PYU1_9HYPH|nr:branched-chain amino acid ABC transporter substrate-binding protein [Neorhizobium huautlense]MDP9839607.1 branched-chain amino acid transport system substrate-binding protein [Neorhizobium huautlense]